MIYPAIGALLENVDSRYTLVIEVAKRARQLTNGAPKLTSFESNKAVTLAVHEVYEGKVVINKGK